ncbi:MAG: hypothetical protein V7739_12585 [Motiliproteus sp.]
MTNFISGLVAMIMLSLFIGGLAYSIWDNTGSLAFPVIVVAVWTMAFVGFIEEVKSGADHT